MRFKTDNLRLRCAKCSDTWSMAPQDEPPVRCSNCGSAFFFCGACNADAERWSHETPWRNKHNQQNSERWVDVQPKWRDVADGGASKLQTELARLLAVEIVARIFK